MDATREIETTRRVVYRLNAPACWVELEKVFACIRQESTAIYDDQVRVECWDDEVRITYDASLLRDETGER